MTDTNQATASAAVDTPQVATVRSFYEGLSSPEGLRPGLLADDMRCELAEGFPHGGLYVGGDAFLNDFFGAVLAEYDDWAANPVDYRDGGDRVYVEGRYSATAKATGKPVDAAFVHIWYVEDDTLVRVVQHTDTVLVHEAAGAVERPS